jgi:N-acetylmuramoyl-L-alanine amidase
MPAAERASASDKYRQERPTCDRELRFTLAQLSESIADPVAKLRYLRRAIEAQHQERIVRHIPGAPIRRALYRRRGLAALEPGVGNSGNNVPDSTRRASFRVSALAAAALVVPVLIVAGMAFGTGPRPRTESAVEIAAPPATASLPIEPAPLQPAAYETQTSGPIWLADRGPGWELFSNGLRIETTYAVPGERRQYRIHNRIAGLQPTLYTHPVGILFHTSESDLWPLEPDYGRKLRRSTAGLLKYVRANQSYNYLIDRFGRVYRVVEDDSRASHAGHSVWARGDEVYLDLNSAFLGVSFESRWDGGRSLPITAAQLQAGRNLTDYLRQRFAIAPEMCVTHGLASVSPLNHRIGYHLDWARGFPFAAFGLPDLYEEPTPSIVLFGFGYDERFLRDVGEPWPGLMAADHALAQTAAARALSLSEVRHEGRALYQRWSRDVSSDDP